MDLTWAQEDALWQVSSCTAFLIFYIFHALMFFHQMLLADKFLRSLPWWEISWPSHVKWKQPSSPGTVKGIRARTTEARSVRYTLSFISQNTRGSEPLSAFLITPDLQEYVLMTLPKGHDYFCKTVFS